MSAQFKVQVWEFMEIIRDTGCNLTKPICSAIMLILFSFFRIEGEYVSSLFLFCPPCWSFWPLFQFPSCFIFWLRLCEKGCVNCKNSKSPGQLPSYLHFKSVAFCPVCFSLLKMYELTVQEKLFCPRSAAYLKNLWKKGFYPPTVLWRWRKRDCCPMSSNQCILDPVSPGQKNMLILKLAHTYRHGTIFRHTAEDRLQKTRAFYCITSFST